MPLFLPNIKCKDKSINIFSLLNFTFNKKTIIGTIKIICKFIECLKFLDKITKNKIILLKKNLTIIRNYRCAIYRCQDKFLPSAKFYWFEPIARLFYLQMNIITILFGQSWNIIRNIIFLNCFSGILKQRHIKKLLNNNSFYYFDNFFYIVVKALVIALFMYAVSCQIIDSLQAWINKLDWPLLIHNIKQDFFGVFKVYIIWSATPSYTNTDVAATFMAKFEKMYYYF